MQTLPLFADAVAHVLDENWLGPVTKYQILAVAAAGIVFLLMTALAQKVRTGEPVRGPLWNFLETLLLFVRDEVVRPNVHNGHDHHHDHEHHDDKDHGHHGHDHPKLDPHATADRYVPLMWTVFLFVLTCNLLGMIPFLGSPTASLSVTLALAGVMFVVITGSALMKLGPVGYIRSFIPSLKADNVPMQIFLTVFIVPLIFVIEFLGSFLRAAILAVRLFANLFAGHVALGVIFAFALAANGSLNVGGGAAAVVLGTALSMLELFVAFLQAFVFTLLASIFLGMQLNPEH